LSSNGPFNTWSPKKKFSLKKFGGGGSLAVKHNLKKEGSQGSLTQGTGAWVNSQGGMFYLHKKKKSKRRVGSNREEKGGTKKLRFRMPSEKKVTERKFENRPKIAGEKGANGG